MNYYRCTKKSGGSGDFSSTYMGSINGVKPSSATMASYFLNTVFDTQISKIIIGNNVRNCRNAFEECKYIPNVYFQHKNVSISVWGMFLNTNSTRKNIFFHSSMNEYFNGMTSFPTGTLPQWSYTTNCYYNTKYNIYCYYNYNS